MTEMYGDAVVATAYLLGWLIAIPLAMRRHMLRELCNRCWRAESAGHRPDVYHSSGYRFVALGAMRERNGGDVAWALFAAAFWPTHLLWAIIVRVARLLGAGVERAVNKATPLTAPELERRIAEQQREITRLTDVLSRPKA